VKNHKDLVDTTLQTHADGSQVRYYVVVKFYSDHLNSIPKWYYFSESINKNLRNSWFRYYYMFCNLHVTTFWRM